MSATIDVRTAEIDDAARLAELHMASRDKAMPYLPQLHEPPEIRDWFARRLRKAVLGSVWIARMDNAIVGYLVIHEEEIDDLYIQPGMERRGIGKALLDQAKLLSPQQLKLSAFQRNVSALAFYEAQGFRVVGSTGGKNEENEPDFQLLWDGQK